MHPPTLKRQLAPTVLAASFIVRSLFSVFTVTVKAGLAGKVHLFHIGRMARVTGLFPIRPASWYIPIQGTVWH